MTETEWVACDDPKAMLAFLHTWSQASKQNLRLFSCAACRRVWPLLTDERARRAIEVAERYADGAATDEEREAAQREAAAVRQLGGVTAKWAAATVARTGAIMIVDAAGQTAACPPEQEYDPVKWQGEWRAQCPLLRDLFGFLPFRPIQIDPSWRTPTVVTFATTIYDGRDFAAMPVLADALEESGCDDPELLGHLRQQGQVHVRGCWALDAILGKS
jgi:hypothetical protein